MLEVVEPGLLSTVQDTGRPDYVDLGVSTAGACDPHALAMANLLAGNDPAAACLEMTLAGPLMRVLTTCVIALAGAELGGRVPQEDRALPVGGAYLVRAGTTVELPGGSAGARAYLALAGGIVVPEVLGSASTDLRGRFGGLEGRPLRPGDRLRAARGGDLRAAGRRWPEESVPGGPWTERPVRVVPGPHLDHLGGAAWEGLLERRWEVLAESDRMGVRLVGEPLPTRSGGGELLSQGMVVGAVQVPPDRLPICLLADHQTVGGYPVAAVVIGADLPLLAQGRPGERISFRGVTLEEAVWGERERRATLRRAAELLARVDREDADGEWWR